MRGRDGDLSAAWVLGECPFHPDTAKVRLVDWINRDRELRMSAESSSFSYKPIEKQAEPQRERLVLEGR